MEKTDAKVKILDRVRALNGIGKGKATEIVNDREIAEIIIQFGTELFDEMVKEGLLIELEYTLSIMPDRLKSFFLPGDTKVRLRASEIGPGNIGIEYVS